MRFIWGMLICLPAVAGNVSLSPSTSVSFGAQAVGDSVLKAVKLTNGQSVPLTFTAIAASGDYTQTNNCGVALGAGAYCTITVTFTPAATGARMGALTITDDGDGSPRTLPLSGTGLTPVTLSSSALSFGYVAIDSTSAAKTVTLTNNQASPLAVSAISVTGDYAQVNTCGSQVPAKSKCTISVTFTPTALATRSGTLTIVDNGPGSPRPVSLSGTGIVAVTLLPTSIAFGNVSTGTTSTAKTVKLTNYQSGPVTIASIAVSGDFAQTNTCGTQLPAASSCMISVTFHPTAVGARSGAITVIDDGPGSPRSVALSGKGVAAVFTSVQSLSFGGAAVGTSSDAKAVVLTNNQAVPLNIASISASGDFAQTSDCGAQVQASASCTILVTFTPSAAGIRTGALTITDSGSGSPRTVTLSGNGTVPVTLSPTSWSFPSVGVGNTSAAKNITLTNKQSVPLNISSITASGDFAQTNTCGNQIAANASCVIAVTFTPTTAQTITGAVTITDSAAGSPRTVSLSGKGVASVSLSPSALSFGMVYVGSTSTATTVTLTNEQSVPLHIGSIAVTGNFAQTNNCGSQVPANGSCTITTTFTPVATGTQTGVLTVMDDGYGSPRSTSLSGTGVSDATITPTSVIFSKTYVGKSSAVKNVTFKNKMTVPIQIASIAADGDFTQTNGCGAQLAAASSCTIGVTFTPSAEGTRTGTLVIIDSGPGSPRTVPLSGPAVGSGTVTYAPASLTFSAQPVGQTSTAQIVTLTNGQSVPLHIANIAVLGDFAQTNGCGAQVAANSSCTISVTFTPTVPGTRTGSLTITDDGPGSPRVVALGGTGAAAVNISPTALDFGNQTTGQTSASKSVTLMNSQPAVLNIASISVSGDFGQTNNCGTQLAANSSCSINVTFTPTTTGTVQGLLTITDDGPGSPRTVSLSGAGTGGPLLTASPASLSFGSVTAGGSSSIQQVTISNNSGSTVGISSITASENFGQTNTCGTLLANGSWCLVKVSFTPGALGVVSGTVTVDASGGAPLTISLTGTGVSAISLSGTSVAFPNTYVGGSPPAAFVRVTNRVNGPLQIGNFAVSGDFTQVNSCFPPVGAFAYCYIQVGFNPTTSGARTGSVTFVAGAANEQISVPLSGNGVTSNLLGISIRPITPTMPAGTTIALSANGDFNTNAVGSFTAARSQDITSAVAWSSNNLDVATVDSTGVVTGVSSGTATITAGLGGVSGTVAVTVVSNIVIKPRVVPVRVNRTAQFQLVTPNNAAIAVTWYVDGIAGGDASVGTVSANGAYTAPDSIGPHTVTATAQSDANLTASATVNVTNSVPVATWHNDNGRTGQNRTETILTPANVNSNQFGRLFTYDVDGQIYAQPLYVPNVNIPGRGVMNVVYVATQHDSVYAFDADGKIPTPLWKVSFIDPANGIVPVPFADVENPTVSPENGIGGTPVIDVSTQTLYAVAFTRENGTYIHRLHALDITNGTEKFGGPVNINLTYPGTGDGADSNGSIQFTHVKHRQRPGLLLVNGNVYVGFGAQNDHRPSHGWLAGYNKTTLQQVAVANTTPNASLGSFWNSGAGPAADAAGYMYLSTGNGPYDGLVGQDYGDSFVKLPPDTGFINVVDHFAPFNEQNLEDQDRDLGSGGAIALPDQSSGPTHLLIGAGKEGTIYVMNRDNMGGFHPSDNSNAVQSLPSAVGAMFATPAFWNNAPDGSGLVYFQGSGSPVRAFQLSGGLLTLAASSQQSMGFFGASPSVSSNGMTNGIVWVLTINNAANGADAELRAFNASNVAQTLYLSNSVAGRRDVPGQSVKFTPPTVADGRVFVPTGTRLSVYGLIP